MLPLVSICIPNYNNAPYLVACLDSALAQTWAYAEIVCVDDASTDDSLAILGCYGDRIRLYHNQTNLGQPATTNRCVELARGQYVVILHSDDLLLPHFIERLVPILERHTAASLAVGERFETDKTGTLYKVTPFYKSDCLIPGERQAKVFLFMSFLPCQVLVRRTVFMEVGGADLRHVVNLDGLLWFKCALAGDVGYLREPVGVYRRHATSTSAQYNRRIDHMIQYYATLSTMMHVGRGRPYLEQHFAAAVKRVGELTVRYCRDVFREGDYELVKRYLSLATVFDPTIVDSHAWRTMKYCAESTSRDPGELYRLLTAQDEGHRTWSYDPPDGFLQLDIPEPAEVHRES